MGKGLFINHERGWAGWIRGWATVFKMILGGGPGIFYAKKGGGPHILFTLKFKLVKK